MKMMPWTVLDHVDILIAMILWTAMDPCWYSNRMMPWTVLDHRWYPNRNDAMNSIGSMLIS